MVEKFRRARLVWRVPCYWYLCMGLLGLSSGAINCKSTVGAGQIRAEKAAENIEDVAEEIEEAENVTPQQKKAWAGKLKAEAKETRQLGQDVDHNKEIADKNQAAASKWHWVIGIFSVVSVAGIGLFIWKKVL